MSTLSMLIVTYFIEYQGEFEFIFKNILDYESVDKMCSFDAKNRHQKSHAWAPLMSSCKYILFKVWFTVFQKVQLI